jgi:hypothetical protein
VAKPKTLIKGMLVNQALRAHNCQHSSDHRIIKGDYRLCVKNGRNTEYFCVNCAKAFLNKAKNDIVSLMNQLPST